MLQLKLNMEKEGVHMSKRETYEARTEELITPILERMYFELVDVEYVKEGGTWYLRAYIDKEGGITVNDCEAVAREMNEILDREDFVEDSYVFEVSSPGLGRPLKKEKDYVRRHEVPDGTFGIVQYGVEVCSGSESFAPFHGLQWLERLGQGT